MIPNFTEAEKAVHYPSDRRAFLGMKLYVKVILAVLIIGVFGAAWAKVLIFGLPVDPSVVALPKVPKEAFDFPIWVNLSHWVNFFFFDVDHKKWSFNFS